MTKKSQALKKVLNSKKTEYFLEAHNGVSAKIVEEAGFPGVWASSLGISAALGVRDNNEASWTQILEMVEFMNDSVDVPILMDGDSGHGNFNNTIRLVKKLEQRGIAGLCIEDKEFPKKNSFIDSESQGLVSREEFVGKIMAAKDTAKDTDFCLIARTESLIVGQPMEEALERCHSYYQAGADAILIHSKSNNVQQIREFVKHWNNGCPLVIVPTTYYTTPTEEFEEMGISLVLWANHMIRSSIYQMQKIASQIYRHKSIEPINDQIVSIGEVFRLQNMDEYESLEKRYSLK